MAWLAWLAFISYASLTSFEEDDTPSFNIPHLDKVVHFTFYFVAAVLMMFFLRERTSGKISLLRAIFISLLCSVAFGIIIEVLQHVLTADRQGDILDAIANTVGALVGVWAIKLLFSRTRRLKWEI